MKQSKIVAFIIIWAVIILAAIGYIAVSQSSGGMDMLKLNFGINLKTILLKEESISSEDIKIFEVTSTYEAIEFVAADGQDFHIIQYGNETTSNTALFSMVQDGDKLSVSTNKNIHIQIGINFGNDKLIIAVPQTWLGAVNLKSSSGSISVKDVFTLENFDITASSGSIRIEKQLNTDDLKISSSSGSIKIEDNINAKGDFGLKSNSGSQRIDGVVNARNIKFGTSSGSIRIKGELNCEGETDISSSSGSISVDGKNYAKSFRGKSSSGTIRLEEMKTEGFDVHSASGSIKIEGISGMGRLESSSGSIAAEFLSPTGDVSVKSTSGSVRLAVSQEASFQFEADTNSGNIKTDFETMYSSNRKNNAVATVGSNPTVKIMVKTSSGSIKLNRI